MSRLIEFFEDLRAAWLRWRYRNTTVDWNGRRIDSIQDAMWRSSTLRERCFPPTSRHMATDIRSLLEQYPSNVKVNGLDQVRLWLRGCEYVEDDKMFGVGELWQLPAEFEESRRGDCDDHAVWAWKKLVDLGYEARLAIGDMGGIGHCWINIRSNGKWYVFETTSKYSRELLLPVKWADDYWPEYTIDADHYYEHAPSRV